MLKCRLKEAPVHERLELQNILNDIQKRIFIIPRAEKSILNVEGKIFFGVLACCMTTFLMSNHYINTSIQKAGIPGFLGCLEQMIWNSILSAKRDKIELHVIWLDLANAYGSVPHHLIQMALDFFNFPSKVGEIIMKYFNSTFMKFTIKDYIPPSSRHLRSASWWAVWFPHFF